jgi:hypothetical protein
MVLPLTRRDPKRPLPDGRGRLVLAGVELLEKLAPLRPPVYANPARLWRHEAAQHPHGIECLHRRAGCGRRWCHRRPSRTQRRGK